MWKIGLILHQHCSFVELRNLLRFLVLGLFCVRLHWRGSDNILSRFSEEIWLLRESRISESIVLSLSIWPNASNRWLIFVLRSLIRIYLQRNWDIENMLLQIMEVIPKQVINVLINQILLKWLPSKLYLVLIELHRLDCQTCIIIREEPLLFEWFHGRRDFIEVST